MNKESLIKAANVVSKAMKHIKGKSDMFDKAKEIGANAGEKVKDIATKHRGKIGFGGGAGVAATAGVVHSNNKDKKHNEEMKGLVNTAKKKIYDERGKANQAIDKAKRLKERSLIDRVINKDV